MAMSAPQQQQQPPSKVEYFYVYVAESEFSTVGYWIQLEPDKSLSLESLRGYFSTCFGIKHKIVNACNGIEVRYIRYHNGYFRFPPGLDLNNTRFVAYYYSDVDDIRSFMDMVDSNDDVGDAGEMPTLTLKTPELPSEGSNNDDSTLLGRTMDIFLMDSVLRRGAQSTPVKGSSNGQMPPVRENVSSTSDVILNEPPVEMITINDTKSTLQCPFPPPPGPPKDNPMLSPSTSSGIRAKLGPNVSSTSDEKRNNAIKHERITINDSSGFQRERSSVMVTVNTAPQSRNMLDRYQHTRPSPQNVYTKTPLKVTFKGRGRQVQRNKKILKIEDYKGRTTALLTKKKWTETAEPRGQKRRSESGDELEERYEKRRRYENQYHNYQKPETKPLPAYGNDLLEINVLLVGFHNQRPIDHETIKYFSDFGIVTNLQVSPQENRHSATEYYAFMKIRTNDALSLFSDRHLYNRTIIYAIRVDGTRPPLKLTCKLCGYYGLNVGYLHYHLEGQCHQHHLTKRLESRAAELGHKVYLDSYYRISSGELFVQYPANNVQEMVRHDYWRRCYQPATYSSGADARPDYRNYYSSADNGERYY
ncbi:uncharacterized protein LOC135717305 [Ochlerotatus camptorhynchus]|uniref:uncharacterized protein LOC135717305 n=1 Tax=Ochlerotatus camptorhynchus TaxID=644619 RepID=UPI0031D4F18B